MKLPTTSCCLIILFIYIKSLARVTSGQEAPLADRSDVNKSNNNNERPSSGASPPAPISSASYLSLDGLTLVVVFDRPVNLSDSIETIERRKAMEASEQLARGTIYLDEPGPAQAGEDIAQGESSSTAFPACQELKKTQNSAQTQYLVQGIQLCAKLLSKRTLKLLHKFKLHNCIWPSRVQFLIKLSKPINNNATPIKINFQRGTLSEHDQPDGAVNEQEVSVELNKLPLESLGVPLSPRLALIGPNQVPPCGQFSLTAHLSSAYGVVAGDSVKINWSVEKIGFIAPATSNVTLATVDQHRQLDNQQAGLKWQTLQHLVRSNKGNSLVLDAQLLQFVPQLYEFYVSATFVTSFTTVSLNATHQVSRLDYETPIGTLYGSHILAQQQQVNPQQQIMLLADIQVPECANNIKQVGLYWQVSDARVQPFEQTFAPYYLAKPNSLPEQALTEFRLNLFYGIRVKRYSSAGTVVPTGDSVLDSYISNGLLILTVGQESLENNNQLELYAATSSNELKESNKYSYLWSCFDGKTAQPCFKSFKVITQANNTTRYDVASRQTSVSGEQPASSGVLLIDQHRQTQPVLRIPLSWIDPDAQLWFGLQRFNKSLEMKQQQPQQQQQHTEYALVTVQPGQAPVVSIGPVLIGRSRQRATIRNPLTGAVVLVENTPVVIIGRLSSPESVRSFAWHSTNFIQPLHWTSRNETNSLSGQKELVTELHLNPNLQVAFAHFQLQLTACTESGFATANLHLDVVQGVSQCRVEASQNALTNSLIVSVDYCNIPLGLSPITYQIYVADTSASDGFIDANNNNNNHNNGQQAQAPLEDDYMNESDEAFLESLAQPMTVAQLSPVFSLSNMNTQSLLAMLDPQLSTGNVSSSSNELQSRQQVARLRFAARVCNRIQSCRLFYSPPISARSLLSQLTGLQTGTNNQSSSATIPATSMRLMLESNPADRLQAAQSMLKSMQTMIDASRRVNLAGNSIAAVSVLNGVINLGQKLMSLVATTVEQSQRLTNSNSNSNSNHISRHDANNVNNRAKDLLQVAVRECLRYGNLSLQRQFHFTDSGQTNLMTHVMAKILTLASSSIEFKFKAMRLMAQLTKRSIAEQVNLKVNCVADLRTLQWGYEALFGTFSHYSAESTSDTSSRQHSSLLEGPSGGNTGGGAGGNNNNNSSSNNIGPSVLLNSNSISASISNSSLRLTLPEQQTNKRQSNSGTSVNRKKREEAILAYLKSIRLAYRALLSSAAIQVPLGDSQQFQYAATSGVGGERGETLKNNANNNTNNNSTENGSTNGDSSDRVSTVKSRLESESTTSGSDKVSSSPVFQATTTSTAATITTSSDIVSSLTHLTELPTTISTQATTTTSSSGAEQQAASNNGSTLYVDLHEFGSISLTFNQKFLARFNSRLSGRELRCRNDTTTKCSTFVLSITSFAGKAPFRSLDLTQSLRVPVLEVSLLSPVDGSNLLDLIKDGHDEQFKEELGEASDHFRTTVTFTIPEFVQPEQANSGTSSTSRPHASAESSSKHERRRYKCYQFDEEKNEWIRSSLSEKQQPEDVLLTNTNNNVPSANLNSDQESSQWPPLQSTLAERRIKCSFNGLGIFSAFQGKPPSAEAAMSSPVVIALSVVLALVALFSVFACFASSPSSAPSSSSSSESGSEKRRAMRNRGVKDADQADDLEETRHEHGMHRALDQTTYRNNFENYPRL